jgi:hypothetical protein
MHHRLNWINSLNSKAKTDQTNYNRNIVITTCTHTINKSMYAKSFPLAGPIYKTCKKTLKVVCFREKFINLQNVHLRTIQTQKWKINVITRVTVQNIYLIIICYNSVLIFLVKSVNFTNTFTIRKLYNPDLYIARYRKHKLVKLIIHNYGS